MCRLTDADVDDTTTKPDDGKGDDAQTGEVTGSKDADGHTTAASVNSVKDRGKSDEYPTTGNSETVSNNGYYTGANVDIGDAVLVYDLLDMVNEARKAEGLNELEWVKSDAAEEYTLVRAMDLAKNFSHFGGHAGIGLEVIAWGAGDAEGMFQSWMDSEGHRETLMYDENIKYMSAARCGANWIITIWADFDVENAEKAATDNYNW